MVRKNSPKKTTKALVPSRKTALARVSLDTLASIPEEAVWLESRKSARTRRAYRTDVAHFMRMFNITTPEELRQIDHRAVYTWERQLREVEGREASTVRRRLAALSSLFTHLIKFGVVEVNPVRDVERPAINRREGMTRAFSQKQARKILGLCRKFSFEAIYGMISLHDPGGILREKDDGDQLQRCALPPSSHSYGSPLVCCLSAEHTSRRRTHGGTRGGGRSLHH